MYHGSNENGTVRKISLMKKYVFIVIGSFLIFVIYFNAQIIKQNDNQFGERLFKIEKGEGVAQIAKNLDTQGFLNSAFWFKVYVAASGNKAKFIDGEYKLRTDLNIKELTRQLTGARFSNKEVDVTLLEGWTIAEMDEYLVKRSLIKPGELVAYSENFAQKDYFFLFDRPKNVALQGYLYPDTYRVYAQTSVAELARKMLENFDQKLTPEMRAEIKKQKKSIFDVITLASIVEREMFGYENRRIVADIFLKRLKSGMALQSDATVNFITQKGLAAPSLDDLKVESLYNTYKYPGLPPGPICNPSIEAIKAVIYPAKTNYWYFLNTPQGEIVFSKTHDEHVDNKFKYLK